MKWAGESLRSSFIALIPPLLRGLTHSGPGHYLAYICAAALGLIK